MLAAAAAGGQAGLRLQIGKITGRGPGHWRGVGSRLDLRQMQDLWVKSEQNKYYAVPDRNPSHGH